MDHTISVKKKQAFLSWFLNHYRLKKRESFWILNYLLNHPHILNHVHFVHDITYCPRGLVITSVCSNEVAFLFRKNHIVTTDAEKAFHDLRLNKEEPLFIQLQCNKTNHSIWFAGILEENPFLQDSDIITEEDEKNAAKIMHNTLYVHQKKILLKKIDDALDKRNEQMFNELVDQLLTLDANKGNPPVLHS